MTDVDGGASEPPRDERGAVETSRTESEPPATARDDSDAQAPSPDTAGEPFAIPQRPTRRYPHSGGVEYDGETVFVLTPEPSRETGALRDAVERVLDSAAYTYGDWFDLPMPLYLVHDEETGDVFRVSIRDGRIRFHVLPATESAGLAALYERLRTRTDVEWSVECRTDG